MPKMPPFYQQQRRVIGTHTNWQDDNEGNQRRQDQRVKRLAMRPGLHTENVRRQNLTHAMIQLISILSMAQTSSSNPARLQKRPDASFIDSSRNYGGSGQHLEGSKQVDMSKWAQLADSLKPTMPMLASSVNKSASGFSKYTTSSTAVLNVSNFAAFKTKDHSEAQPIFTTSEEMIIFGEQTRHLSKFLEKNGYHTYKVRPFERINNLVSYLAEGGEERIKMVAKTLLKASGEYGSGHGENIPPQRQLAIVVAYFNRVILGMPLYIWIAKKIQQIRLYDLHWFDNKYLRRRINVVLTYTLNENKLSLATRKFYQNTILKKLLPTLSMKLTEKENKKLHKIDITQPRWGFIHAGAMLLNDLDGLNGATLEEIEDIGITLHAMLWEGAIAGEFISYFTLPALIYYAKHVGDCDLLMLSEAQMQVVYFRYFRYTKQLQVRNDPLIQLSRSLQIWKTRTELARQELFSHSISDEWVVSYLNEHDELKIGQSTLPNIDKVFEEQNLKFARINCEIETLLLSFVLSSLSETEQQFIKQAEVDRVAIEFNARDSIRGVPLPPASRMGIEESGALIHRIPEHIDLLRCTLNEEEHIYALDISSNTKNFGLVKVDRDRKALFSLLKDKKFRYDDQDYKIKVTSQIILKKQSEKLMFLIENLVKYREKKLLKKLHEQGYDKTTQEKVIDFLLDLVPFYTCITESIKGNEREAIPACMFDVVGLIPFAKLTAITGIRFSTALGKSTMLSLSYGAKQTMFKGMFKQTGKNMITQFPSVAHEISPRVLQRLVVKFARCIDPGFELLALGGAKGSRAIRNVLSKVPNKSLGLTRLSEALAINSVGLAPNLADKNLQIKSLFSPKYDKKLNVACVGEDQGKQIWVQVDTDTGSFFGRRFIVDEKGNLEENPLKIRLTEVKKKQMIYDQKNDCYRVKRGAKLGKLCSHHDDLDNPEDHDLAPPINFIPPARVQARVSGECERIIREWNHLDVYAAEDVAKLEQLAQKATDEQILNDFIEAGNEKINQYLRYGEDTPLGRYAQEAIALQDVCNMLENYEDFSYRIMLLPSLKINSFKINDIISDKGFSSSSALVRNAKEWLGSQFIKQHQRPNNQYVLMVYDKNVPKKMAGNDFLIDHILILPNEKIQIDSLKTFQDKGKSITVLGVSKYYGNSPSNDIFL